eukprot:9333-Pyramimonas_sp.AAC.1
MFRMPSSNSRPSISPCSWRGVGLQGPQGGANNPRARGPPRGGSIRSWAAVQFLRAGPCTCRRRLPRPSA